MNERAPYYVESAAIITGPAAHVLDRVLASPNVRRVLANLPEPLRSETEAARRAIARAGAAYEARPITGAGSAETPLAETSPWSPHDLTTEQAACILGVTDRRVRQIAGDLGGTRLAGRWSFSRTAVLAYRDGRSA